tara:strand:+ start:583 stop:1485 length:903 start_codon:yes stop_codon:yes gene_type:complete
MYWFFIRSLTKLIIYIDKFLNFFRIKDFLTKIHDGLEDVQYYNKDIEGKKIKFFCPTTRCLKRVNSLYQKEPETLNWINNFEKNLNINKEKIVFWDIGANIGLYSIYAAVKFTNIEIISFEPSTSNTRTLSRNISINKLYDKIKILPIALADKSNIISKIKETSFVEGSSMSTFGNNLNYMGVKTDDEKIKNQYQILGNSIDYLVENKTLKIPNYIKIDVDGIENLILRGATNTLKKKELVEISIELNPTNKEQYENIVENFKKNNFLLVESKNYNLIKNPNHKLNLNETVNSVFRKKSI